MNGRSLGIIFLCLYLFVVALLLLTNISFVFASAVQGILALLAGIFLLLGK